MIRGKEHTICGRRASCREFECGLVYLMSVSRPEAQVNVAYHATNTHWSIGNRPLPLVRIFICPVCRALPRIACQRRLIVLGGIHVETFEADRGLESKG
jgi:hypothetical protein